MLNKTYRWSRPNEEVVKFRGFSKDELTQIYPALAQTDKYLSDKKRLNASFVKAKPIVGRLPARAAAETRYSPLFGKAKVYVNPQVFNDNRYQWEPSGVVSHEIGHLIGPARRGNSNPRERREFRKAFSYRQKKVVHEYAPQLWAQRRNSPLQGAKTRQSKDAAEDFAETWRHLTGMPFTNRTNSEYFNVITTPQRVEYMNRRVFR